MRSRSRSRRSTNNEEAIKWARMLVCACAHASTSIVYRVDHARIHSIVRLLWNFYISTVDRLATASAGENFNRSHTQPLHFGSIPTVLPRGNHVDSIDPWPMQFIHCIYFFKQKKKKEKKNVVAGNTVLTAQSTLILTISLA